MGLVDKQSFLQFLDERNGRISHRSIQGTRISHRRNGRFWVRQVLEPALSTGLESLDFMNLLLSRLELSTDEVVGFLLLSYRWNQSIYPQLILQKKLPIC